LVEIREEGISFSFEALGRQRNVLRAQVRASSYLALVVPIREFSTALFATSLFIRYHVWNNPQITHMFS